jgi:hypothetical protein
MKRSDEWVLLAALPWALLAILGIVMEVCSK